MVLDERMLQNTKETHEWSDRLNCFETENDSETWERMDQETRSGQQFSVAIFLLTYFNVRRDIFSLASLDLLLWILSKMWLPKLVLCKVKLNVL